jgi:predicted ATPase
MKMKVKVFEFSHIKSYKTLRFDLEKTSVLVGKNDHGKSSILKVIDILWNQISEEMIKDEKLSSDITEQLLPVVGVNAKARRITIIYGNNKRLYITIRNDSKFIISDTIGRNISSSSRTKRIFRGLRENNIFVFIPSVRDTSSSKYKGSLRDALELYGLSQIITKKVGGTSREYRTLKDIRIKISTDVKGYINDSLLPKINDNVGFSSQHSLGLKFSPNIEDLGAWIIDNLQLGFEIDGNVLPLSEAGSGIQSAVMLSLLRLKKNAKDSPEKQFIFAIEEPEAFLHPQKQRELYGNLVNTMEELNNIKVIITTHSPYIVSETPFEKIGLVRKNGNFSELDISKIDGSVAKEIFEAFNNSLNAEIFFAEKVIFVEGESDFRVIRTLLEKKLGNISRNISVIPVGGNEHFSPLLRMIRSFEIIKIPCLVVTDFDSLTSNGERAIFTPVKAVASKSLNQTLICQEVDAIVNNVNASENDFRNFAERVQEKFENVGVNTFVFSSDLEYSIVSDQNKKRVIKILREQGFSGVRTDCKINNLRKIIGSKCIPLASSNGKYKKPYIHKKIADTIDLSTPDFELNHPDLFRLLELIERI